MLVSSNSPKIDVNVHEAALTLAGFRTGTWSLAGGHLELHESFEACAIREVKEETNLDIDQVKFLTATESFFTSENNTHYVTIFMTAVVKEGTETEPTVSVESDLSIPATTECLLLTSSDRVGNGTGQMQNVVLAFFRRPT